MRIVRVAGMLGVGVALSISAPRDARACGGCFQRPNESGTVITDHRMIFAVSQGQTTLYDQIEYQGAPSSFAWVLPIHAPVVVGLSSDAVFASMERATRTTLFAPQCFQTTPSAAGGLSASDAASAVGVTIISRDVVGPYDTVQLQSTDPTALDTWLAANGFAIPADISPVIAAYVGEGFDFLAMRLVPGQGIAAMRPVSVTSPGAGVSLPLRMVAAGTGATVGITLWVVADGRYEPQNFPFFTLSASELVWDYAQGRSNYNTLRAQTEAALNNSAWQIESSIDVTPYAIESGVLYGVFPFGGVAAVPAADAGYTALAAPDGGPGLTADEARKHDLATLFPSMASRRITRMRADLSHAALANDLRLQASLDQSTLSNVYQVRASINGGCGFSPGPAGGSDAGGSSSSGAFASDAGGGSPSDASSSSGAPGSGGSGNGTGGSSSGNPYVPSATSDAGASPSGKSSSSCAASPGESTSSGLAIALAGFLGLAFVRARARRRSGRM
ncbi:MAG: DUF2330 domain-containing protein [Myxococcota bacterium]|nr:DUF2330 domain-containing protein [Myxococcota bacterium]